LAARLFDRFVDDLEKLCPEVRKGRFGAEMDVRLCNWGPVTLVLDSAEF
jgi:D-tyrosyl-tRNA(Tyr) deacylase